MVKVNSSMINLIYCKNFCKRNNVPPPSTTIKKDKKVQKIVVDLGQKNIKALHFFCLCVCVFIFVVCVWILFSLLWVCTWFHFLNYGRMADSSYWGNVVQCLYLLGDRLAFHRSLLRVRKFFSGIPEQVFFFHVIYSCYLTQSHI
jgi:hypothetical protein